MSNMTKKVDMNDIKIIYKKIESIYRKLNRIIRFLCSGRIPEGCCLSCSSKIEDEKYVCEKCKERLNFDEEKVKDKVKNYGIN